MDARMQEMNHALRNVAYFCKSFALNSNWRTVLYIQSTYVVEKEKKTFSSYKVDVIIITNLGKDDSNS